VAVTVNRRPKRCRHNLSSMTRCGSAMQSALCTNTAWHSCLILGTTRVRGYDASIPLVQEHMLLCCCHYGCADSGQPVGDETGVGMEARLMDECLEAEAMPEDPTSSVVACAQVQDFLWLSGNASGCVACCPRGS